MDITAGFQFEEPQVFIPWRISPSQLLELADGITEIRRGYFSANCVALNRLNLNVGFCFSSPVGGKLKELQFFHKFSMSLEASYDLYQQHLNETFGPPTQTVPTETGFAWHTWRFVRVRIEHFVFDRFGFEEHVRIRYK